MAAGGPITPCGLKVVPQAKNYLIEPNETNLAIGKSHFDLNHMKGDFTYGYLGEKIDISEGGVDKVAPKVSLVNFMKNKNLDHLDVLHADIQGGELKMLEEAQELLDQQKIHYIFISTHGAEIGIGEERLHQRCLQFLQDHQYHIICEHSTRQSCSIDGLIVARAKSLPGIDHIPMSKYDYDW